MVALTFDTLEATRSLTDAGLPQKHAEAVTRVIKEAQDTHLEELATKGDLKEVRQEVREVRQEMREMRQEIIIKLGGWTLGVAGLAVAILVAYLEMKLG